MSDPEYSKEIPDLSQVETKVLVKEIYNRFETVVVCMERGHRENESAFIMMQKGPHLMCMGMMASAIIQLQDQAKQCNIPMDDL